MKERPLFFLAFSLMAVPLGLSGRDVPLIAGTLIQCTVNEPNFSSRTAVVGDPVVCYARPLQEFGCSAFPRGTQLAGRFVDYRNPGRLHGKGWMRLQFDRLVLPGGEAPITARVISVQGFGVDKQARIFVRGHGRRDAIGWAIPVLWPVKLVTLPRRGPWPTLNDERLVTLRLLDDIHLPCQAGTDFVQSELRPFDFLKPFETTPVLSESDSRRYGVWRRFEGREVQQPSEPTGQKPLAVEVGHHTLTVTSSTPKNQRPTGESSPPAK